MPDANTFVHLAMAVKRGRTSFLGAREVIDPGMPRDARVCPARVCSYVPNRSAARLPLFEKPEDYDALKRVVVEAVGVLP